MIFYIIRKIDKNRFLTYIKNTFDQKKIDPHNFLHILDHSNRFFEEILKKVKKSYKFIQKPSFPCYLIPKTSIQTKKKKLIFSFFLYILTESFHSVYKQIFLSLIFDHDFVFHSHIEFGLFLRLFDNINF